MAQAHHQTLDQLKAHERALTRDINHARADAKAVRHIHVHKGAGRKQEQNFEKALHDFIDERVKQRQSVRGRIRHRDRKHKHGSVPKVHEGSFGIDFAWGNLSPAAAKAAGVKFVCGYLSYDPSKNLLPSEADAWTAAGIPMVVVWEQTAARALAGHDAGVADAHDALTQLDALNTTRDNAIYFACDFDASVAQQGPINAYLDGAASVLGKSRTGVYGSFYVVERAISAGACAFGWQTYAWSGGNVSKQANLLQYSNGHSVGGVGADYDKSLKSDFGQFFVH